jgi:hypothetical protein
MTDWPRPSGRDAGPGRALYPGVPPWLAQGLYDWLEKRFLYKGSSGWHYSTDDLKRLERKLQALSFGWKSGPGSAMQVLEALLKTKDPGHQDVALDAIHLTLQDELGTVHSGDLDALEDALSEAGSEWRVAVRDGRAGLEKRVQPEVAVAAETAFAAGGSSGAWLSQAWTAAFGRDPDPNVAYGDAVKAVEAAAQPVVEPSNSLATLGTMIRVIRSGPGQWELSIRPKDEDPDPVGTLIGMMRLLWRGQRVRHGTGDESAPVKLDQAEAEAAVHLAVTLVQWFRSGSIARR